MGLVGALYFGIPIVILSPLAFVSRPVRRPDRHLLTEDDCGPVHHLPHPHRFRPGQGPRFRHVPADPLRPPGADITGDRPLRMAHRPLLGGRLAHCKCCNRAASDFSGANGSISASDKAKGALDRAAAEWTGGLIWGIIYAAEGTRRCEDPR